MIRFRRLTSEHPYLLTAILFVMILLWGVSSGWPDEYYGFLLLLYFIVSIGIKLDDISNQLTSVSNALPMLLAQAGGHRPNGENAESLTNGASESSIPRKPYSDDIQDH